MLATPAFQQVVLDYPAGWGADPADAVTLDVVTTTSREVPLVILGVVERHTAEPLATLLRQEGMVVAVAVGERGCLRVATAVDPDVILIDPRLPRALVSLLRAHPLSRHAHIALSQALATPVRVGLANPSPLSVR
jgi:hypothetical protein